MKKLLIICVLISLSGCAGVQRALFTPSRSEQYCQKIFGSSDSESVGICIEQERSAKRTLSVMKIPPDIEEKCRQLSDSTGGSYQVMLACVEQELSNRKKGR